MAQQPLVGQAFLIIVTSRSQRDTATGGTLLDKWSFLISDFIHGITRHSHETDVHAFGVIRTRNSSNRAAADPRLRPRGHWDRVSVDSSQIRSLGTESVLYARKELCDLHCHVCNFNCWWTRGDWRLQTSQVSCLKDASIITLPRQQGVGTRMIKWQATQVYNFCVSVSNNTFYILLVLKYLGQSCRRRQHIAWYPRAQPASPVTKSNYCRGRGI